MRNIIRFIAFCVTVAVILFCATYVSQGQVSKSPPYTGTLDSTVFFPAFNKGKAYKVAGNRLGGSGGVDSAYVNSLISGFATLQQIFDTLGYNPGTPTVTVIGSIGTVEPVMVTNQCGIIRWTNSTGSPAGEDLHIKVTYSTAFDTYAVPVISPYVDAGAIVPLSISAPVLPSFEVVLGADIPAGQAVGFTYHVTGK